MPIYEYRCTACGFQSEYLRKVTDPNLAVCPECGKDTFKKLPTAAGFQLKGSGWYATDFKHRGAAPVAAKKDGEAKATADSKPSDAKTDGEAKPAGGSKQPETAPAGNGASGSTTS